MAIRKSSQVLQRYPAQSPLEANGSYAVISEYTIETSLAANDLIEMGALPANCILAAAPIIVADDLDTGTGLTLDCGIFTGQYMAALDDAGAARVCGQEFFTASTVGQTGGLATSTTVAGLKLTPSPVDRGVGFKVVSAAGGNVSGAKLRLILQVVNAPVGI